MIETVISVAGMLAKYLVLFLCIAGVFAAQQSKHGAQVEDNEFAEFEEFDEGLYMILYLNYDHYLLKVDFIS